MSPEPPVDYQTDPSRYRHWKLEFDGALATLVADFDPDGGIRPGYQLKLNSYDLGVDIELHDALNRIRFEHPEVRTVVLTSGKERVFSSGANIFMLGLASHAWKVNFCKFTNETRNGMEDTSAHSGIKFLAAVNGACAGGGYELALACDEIVLVDDRSSAVSLPEVPLLGVLPGTGGLTRMTDKRRVRHDLADVFCTTAEGVRGEKAVAWRLVDAVARPAVFAQHVRERALALAALSDRPAQAPGVALTPLARTLEADALHYGHVTVQIERARRCATLAVQGPAADLPIDIDAITRLGAAWYPLALARELDDAILWLRTNEPEIGLWLITTQGDAQAVLRLDDTLLALRTHWLVRETLGLLRRTLSRLDVSSRSLFALVEPGSCFAGTLLELALACDRIYHLALPEARPQADEIRRPPPEGGEQSKQVTFAHDPLRAPVLTVGEINLAQPALYAMCTGQSRMQRRFNDEAPALQVVRAHLRQPLAAPAALALGLVTSAPDDIDWADEVRIAIEERAALSGDALTGMEANLRFNGPENMATRIFGRLSAWQNWIFQRPGAVGEHGALKVYGSGHKAQFDRTRV